MAHKPSRTRLKIDNAAETVPRVIHGGGKTPDRGEWGLVLRPLTGQALLVLVPKDGSPRAWRGEAHSDAVAMPKGAVASVEAEVAAIKTLLSDDLGPVGAIALRGEWRAWMTCSPDGPLVELERKLAYVTIRVWNEGRGWSWQITRSPRWFAEPRQSPVQSSKQLSAAVLAAVRTATDLAAEACSQRDTRRRGALDDGYTGTRGAAVPSKTRAGRGLSEDWSPGTKAPRKPRARKAAPAPAPAPQTAPMAVEAKAVADAAVEILDAIDRGESIGRPVRAAPVQNALAFLRAMFKSDHPTPWILEGWLFDGKISGDKATVDELMEELDNAVKGKKRTVPADWAERGQDLRTYLEATPRWTWRTRKLITRARELVDRPSCRAPERVAVAKAIQKAADALSRAKADASQKEALQVLGFSALRLASDCAAGQRALFGGRAPVPAPAPKAEPKPAPKRSPRVTKRSRPSNASATQASPQATAPKPARKPRSAPSTKALTQAQKDAAIGQAMKSSMDDALAKLLGGAR